MLQRSLHRFVLQSPCLSKNSPRLSVHSLSRRARIGIVTFKQRRDRTTEAPAQHEVNRRSSRAPPIPSTIKATTRNDLPQKLPNASSTLTSIPKPSRILSTLSEPAPAPPIVQSMIIKDPSPTAPTAYTPPSTGLLSHLPACLIPYGELIRLSAPTGTYYLFFPCLFSSLLFSLPSPLPSPSTLLTTTLLFSLGSLIMRSAGCTINDLLDRNLDPLVSRTRFRPIARGAITPLAGATFFTTQCLAGFTLLLQLPASCLFWAVPSLVLVALYPLAKRVTYYPQVILGLTFSWGALVGGPAVNWAAVTGVADSMQGWAAAALYGSCVAWTVLYDVVYAHMDVGDDRKAGIKSMVVRHAGRAKGILGGLAGVQVGLLAVAGGCLGAGWPFWVGSVGGGAVSLGVLIWRVRLKEVRSCWWWFVNGCLFTGGTISAGLAGEYTRRIVGEEEGKERREVPESAWRWLLRLWRERERVVETGN